MIHRVGLAITCCLVMFLYAVYFGAIGVLLPHVGASFGLGSSLEGRLFPANFLGAIVGVLLCGYLSDLWGRKTVLLLNTIVFALGMCLFGTAPAFALALLATGMIGGGSCAMETVASALASDLYPEKRAFVLNVIQIAFGAGATISPAMAHTLLTHGVTWRMLYIGMGGFNLLLFVFMLCQRFPRQEKSDETLHLSALIPLLKQRAFGCLCLAQALYVGAETGFFSWMPTYFLKRIPEGAKWSGLVVTLFWLAMTFGRAGISVILHRFSLVRLTMTLCAGGATCSLLTLTTQNPVLVMVWVFGTGFFFSGIFGLIMAETGERYSNIAGTAFGGVMAAGGLGGAIVPWSVGVLADTSLDWRGALLVIPLISISTALLLLPLGRRKDPL